MTKLALVTTESIIRNVKGQAIPCIVLIGRDENDKKRMWSTPYWPYMYIKESDFIKIKDDKELNLDKYVKEYLGTFIRSLNKKALTKLILHDYKYINDLQTLLRKYGKVEGEGSIYTYEADLSKLRLLALRYLIDKGIRSGVIIREDNSIEPIEADVNLRIWYIDFEAYTSKMCSYGLKKEDPITMVGFYDTYEDTLYTYYVNNKKWKTLPIFKKMLDKHIIKGFRNEALFLDDLRRKVEQLDPDLFTAWNLDRYDICYDEETEILTENGWKKFKDLIEGEKVATLNRSGIIEYQLPFGYIDRKYNGKMYFVKSKNVDLKVTPDHRMYVASETSNHKVGEFKLREVEDIEGKGLYYKKNGIWIGKEKKWFMLPSINKGRWDRWSKSVVYYTAKVIEINMDLWLEFMGYYLTEGCVINEKRKGVYNILIAQSTSSKHYNKIKECLEKLPFHFGITKEGFLISNKQLWMYLRQFGKSKDKFIPREFLDLSRRQLTILYKSLMAGDGNSKQKTFSSISKLLIGSFQELLLKMGSYGNITDAQIIYRITKTNRSSVHQVNTQKKQDGWVNYEGRIYCVSVPNETLYVRRNGIPIWSGNCKWFQRMKANRLHPNLLSPLKRVVTSSKPYRIKGRITYDLMKAYKKFTASELRSYSLLNVIEEEKLQYVTIGNKKIKLEKIPFKGSVADTWDKYPQIVFKRNVVDVLVLIALNRKHELVEMFDDLRKEFGCLWQELFMNSRILDTALMRFVHHKLALSTAGLNIKQEGKFLGAIVLNPKVGKYKYVAIFDFSKEYPNIMKTFNISPETYRRHSYKGQCYKIKYRDKIFTFVKKPIGLLPQLINFFFKKRDEYEKKQEEAILEGNEVEIKKWKRRIFHIKGLTNAIYGVMDFPSFRLYKKECSAAVAVIGRIGIEQLQKIAKKVGYDVIYGDSDSIFVALKSNHPATALVECLKLEKIFNEKLSKFFIKKYKVAKAPSELGLEKICDNFLMLGRKFYAARYIYDEKKEWNVGENNFIFKGLEIVRSDSSDLEKETLTTIIKMVLTEKKHKEIKDYWSKVTQNFWNKVYDYLQVAYPLQIRRSFRYYAGKDKNGKPKTIPAHVRAALTSNTLLNTDFEAWDKPRRLPIKSKKMIKVKLGRQFREFIIKDIAVAEDMVVEDKYLNAIDWQRIYNRLADKVAKIFRLIHIQTSMEAYK